MKQDTIVFTNHEDRIHNNTIHVRHWGADICDCLECLLADNDIYIPDECREGLDDEACIYGETYDYIEGFVTDELFALKEKIDSCSKEETEMAVKQFAINVCKKFDEIIEEGIEAIETTKDKPNLVPCSLEEDVMKEAFDFLRCSKEYPEYNIDTEDY